MSKEQRKAKLMHKIRQKADAGNPLSWRSAKHWGRLEFDVKLSTVETYLRELWDDDRIAYKGSLVIPGENDERQARLASDVPVDTISDPDPDADADADGEAGERL